ncbi:MAG: UDP-glucose 4-epimerase GalE, partial [Chloroflexota bacterium]|nr:UDP-glucose 4-epimerase GalE [Chloroflexota bacterium]
MNILVTGGAGYVGSVVVEELLEKGQDVTVLDNLQQGHSEALFSQAEFIHGDIRDKATVSNLFDKKRYDAVMHMAAETVVEYSMTDPRRYFESNVTASLNLINSMLEHQVNRIVFSSSASVYGYPHSSPCHEQQPKVPINSYGESKLMFEHILDWYGTAYGIKHISLRYFNAAGATMRLGEDHNPETHLIPNVLKVALGQHECVNIYGCDYQTHDGSCIRDYVHVKDIAMAHVLALNHLDNSIHSGAYNLGNSRGYSVTEVIDVARKITGKH